MIPSERITLRPVTDQDENFLLSVYACTRAAELAQVLRNREGITIEKTQNTDSDYRTLTVSVAYRMPVDLYYFTPRLRRNVKASISY